jgi:hypothetical protein
MKTVVCTFGRMNPPTIGHQLLIDKIVALATKEKGEPVLFLSKSQDKKKNPLGFKDKVAFAKKFFPKVSVPDVDTIKTPINALTWLSSKGVEKVIMVVGSDRVSSFQSFQKYNGKDFDLKEYLVVSAGDRDPDADDATGMSASKMRGFVKVGDYNSFRKGLPRAASETDAKKLYKLLQDVLDEDLEEILCSIIGEDVI